MQKHGAFDNPRHKKPAAASHEARYLFLMILALLAIVLTWTWMKTNRKPAAPDSIKGRACKALMAERA